MKTLVIGDVHGCYPELMDLLNRVPLGADYKIIALGDLIDRGPDSLAVLQFFQNNPQAQSIMGNHERKHLLSFRRLIEPSKSQILTKQQITEEFYPGAIRFISGFPFFIELPEAILIHGCLEPGTPINEQQESVLTGSMSGENYLRKRYEQPWYKLYESDKPIIAGHHDYLTTGRPLIYNDKVFLIDTGCCYGRYLTGLLLPDFIIFTVKSHRNYWALSQQSRRNRNST